ncbi:FCD domain-containing protein [Stakelama tenebrarum]|uniref:FCD domain-containing protein n=1 Tax=Stakelama tenebrarum TaxID=2711215 RepID=A0A6G6Y9K0_9SPHN|nr:FCD domain-containing protein [Sphingosinithalassobacter tenebrarum]QIG81521.1 FCD domain-containing protein [Sphingosinithalassobacter tenebrarum]
MPLLTKVPRKRGVNLVTATTATLREHIFANESGTLLGSLHQLARDLEVGIVTLQQAARVLEHEGVLEVRRGPGGGYYGTRPDDAALERAMDAYLRVHPATYDEALDVTSLLFNELVAAAARCDDAAVRAALSTIAEQFDETKLDQAALGVLEIEFQERLFQMVRRPLFEMLTRVTLHYATSRSAPSVHHLHSDVRRWCAGRRAIIAAIIDGDEALARFEANRQNRRIVRQHLEGMAGAETINTS